MPALLLAGPAGFEESDHLPVNVGEPLDKDEVARVVEDPSLAPGMAPARAAALATGT